ncbi:MAG: alpha-2-macroglobulin family protein [Kofleriaceae bacterium]
MKLQWVAIATACLISACGSKSSTKDEPVVTPTPKVDPADAADGLVMRLSNGRQGAPAADRTKLAPATKLGDAEVAKLLARTKPLVADTTDTRAFALRAGTQPAPKAGQTIATTFPPAPSTLLPPAPTATGELRVLRATPEGAVPIVPEVSVTFSQPMVAVTSQTDAASVVPVTLTPQPKGRWRWLGTRTLIFDPEVRMPQATSYTLEVPAGTKSASGATLAKAATVAFQTPPPTMTSSWPTFGTQRLDVPIFVEFDQAIDPRAMLTRIRVTANKQTVATKLLDEAEIAASKEVKGLVERAKAAEHDGRWLAFRAASKLPADAEIVVEIERGAPSKEGPRTTTDPQSFSFRTYPPLRLTRAMCGWSDRDECRPQTPLRFEFDNALDAKAFDPEIVTIEPATPGLQITTQGDAVVIYGLKKPNTTYKVAIAGSLRDIFDQRLGKATTSTFAVGPEVPSFFGPDGLIVVDPMMEKPTLDVFTVAHTGLAVKLYKVTPADFPRFAKWQADVDASKPTPPPGTKVVDTTLPIARGTAPFAETKIDISPALASGRGHALAIIEPSPWTETGPVPRLIVWAQATRIGLDLAGEADSVQVFATALDTGAPLANTTITVEPAKQTATTDDRGIATIAKLARVDEDRLYYVVATRGDDSAIMTPDLSWLRSGREQRATWFVTDDRTLYRPGENVSFKGWLRTVDLAEGGDVGAADPSMKRVDFTVADSRGNQIAKGSAPIDAFGGFDATFALPKTPNLGYATIHLSVPNKTSHDHRFRIEEFRRPEFEVSAAASQGPFFVGDSGDVTVTGRYFTGAPLPGAQVTWRATASPTSFTPPDREDYTFGTWTPWWIERAWSFDEEGWGGFQAEGRWHETYTHEGKTDATGAHVLHLDFVSVKPSLPMSVTTTATMFDVNRQTWTANETLVVHPSTAYVGLKATRPFVDKGTPYELDVIGVDLDGKLVPGAKITVAAVRLDWKYEKGEYVEKEVDAQTCTATTEGHCTFATTNGGQYKVTATITDAKGRTNTTSMQFWVSGGEDIPSREVTMQSLTLVPDKKEYAPGNTAEVLVQTPFYPAEGLVTWRRSGIVKTERITFDGPSKVVKVPIDDAMTPNMYVQVDVVGTAVRTNDKGQPDPKLPRRPAYASGTLNLAIPPAHRTLTIAVTPAAAKVAPAEKTSVAVAITDAAGKPVANAQALVMVVDEAVLALANVKHASPIDTFYPARSADVGEDHSREMVRLSRPPATQTASNTPGAVDISSGFDESDVYGGLVGEGERGAMGDGAFARRDMAIAQARASGVLGVTKQGYFSSLTVADQLQEESPDKPKPPGDAAPIAVRTNFDPLAVFAPIVTTDANGKATVQVTMPDNLTRYRIVALAVAGDKQFGKGESAMTARLPLMIRPSPPRFLNFGDVFELPVVVQNQTDAPMTVQLAAATTNLALTDGAGRSVTVPANDRVEVRFPAAARMAGTARFQIVGAAGDASDAAELSLPVWTPATTEAFATYGVVDDGVVAQPIAMPDQVVKTFGGLQITTASTNLQALTDAMLYVVRYPFDCAEQRASRILTIAALRDVLTAFAVKDLPSKAELEASMAEDMKQLGKMQRANGGFGFWRADGEDYPYLTVHVMHALARAKDKGYAVPQPMLDRGKDYLRVIERFYTPEYSKETRWAISAYALYVRRLLGEIDVDKARAIITQAGGVDKLGLETDAWLMSALSGNAAAASERAAIVKHAMNRVSETAGAASFTTSYADGAHLILASDRRVDAVMLDALIAEQPANDLIPKLVTGLLAHKKRGRWLNTQENVFALIALERYFKTYEKVAPSFVARVWLGNDFAGEQPFRGRSTKTFQIDVPMADVATHSNQPLTIEKAGAGRLYYRIGMTYAPASLKLEAADYGFVVARTYEGVDDPKDVTRDAKGVWHIKSGARVRVTVSMVNENRRYHVALVDPLPAGLEPVNAELAGAQPDAPRPPTTSGRDRGYYRWWGPWYEHENLRDDRVEAFASYLYEGVHEYVYVARATTPGTIVVPPPKAEEMYMPETFGRGASDRVIVE